ncbi:MAG: membrane protein [Planctomycetota bacterium]|nr:MAG: membrane protein [Planctomycetota bacterium]
MTPDAIFVLLVMTGAFVAFVTEALSVDLVGLAVLVALLLKGVLTPEEAFAGFASEALLTICGMFILSAGLIRAGALEHLTRFMFSVSRGRKKVLLLLLMLTVAVSSAFLNNTPVAVIFLPVVLSVASSLKLAPSKLLIPMSYASIMGGTCTLIGTSTNLLVSQSAMEAGLAPISMFEFSIPGMIFAAVGFGVLALLGNRLLPDRLSVSSTVQEGRIREFVTEVYFPEGSSLINRSYKELLDKVGGITPLMLVRGDDVIFAPLIADPRAQFIREGDVLLLKGDPGAINALLDKEGVTLPPELGDLIQSQGAAKTVTMVELVINPNSPLIGRTIAGSGFSRRHDGAAAIAVLRHDEHLRKRVSQIRLRLGDTLLVVCDEKILDTLRRSSEFILLEGLEEQVVRRDKAPLALGIMVGVVALAALNVLPISTLAAAGVLLMILMRVLPLRLAYNSIDMSIVMLIAGMLALGAALQKTGLISDAAHSLTGALESYGPIAILGGIYLLSAVLTCLVSNNAVAVLMTPLAIESAHGLGFEPAPFLFAALFGASASFATPIGYQTNLFVYAPGGYRFTDYLRLGVPLNVIMFIVAMFVIPWYWPLRELVAP